MHFNPSPQHTVSGFLKIYKNSRNGSGFAWKMKIVNLKGGTMSVGYNKGEIQTFADMLYAKAESIVLMTTIMYGIGGLILGVPLGSFFGRNMTVLAMIIGGCLGGWLGYEIGTYKAFGLKLQAQTSLCQVQIEINTSVMAKNASNVNETTRKSLHVKPEQQILEESQKQNSVHASAPDPQSPGDIDDLKNLTPEEGIMLMYDGKDALIQSRKNKNK
jgi:hypothetical protein